MILQDIPFTLGPAVGQANAALALARQVMALRAALASILRAGDRAARGGRLVEVHGQHMYFMGGAEWVELRRAMIAARNQMVGHPSQTN